MKDIVIIGAGGLGREVKFIIDRINKEKKTYNILGFIDDDTKNLCEFLSCNQIHVIGDINWLKEYKKQICAVIAINNSKVRKKVYEKLEVNRNIDFPNIFAPDLIMGAACTCGKGNVIAFNNIMTVDIKLGDFNVLNSSCIVGHDTNTGNFVSLSPAVSISGNCKIGNLVEVGTGSQVIQNITIQDEIIVGAGSVVTKNIAEPGTYVGLSAKKIK